MFDNEIDWVMRIGHLSLVLAAEEAAGRTTVLMTQYKAEHIVGLQQAIAAANASVQCMKSVFRSGNSVSA